MIPNKLLLAAAVAVDQQQQQQQQLYSCISDRFFAHYHLTMKNDNNIFLLIIGKYVTFLKKFIVSCEFKNTLIISNFIHIKCVWFMFLVPVTY